MMSKVAVIYEGDKSLLDKGLMSQIDGEPEFYKVGDKDESVAYKKLKQMIQLGLAAALFFIVPAHANADATQKKVAKISLAIGVEPQIIRESETTNKERPQFEEVNTPIDWRSFAGQLRDTANFNGDSVAIQQRMRDEWS
jgi:hypothetical protein